jgi:hypothetical protein
MPAQALFGTSVAFGFIAWGIVAAQYFWPLLRAQARVDALRRLLLLHSFRFVGLAVLALLVLAALHSAVGIPLVWVFNVWVFNLWGSADLLYAFYQGNASG